LQRRITERLKFDDDYWFPPSLFESAGPRCEQRANVQDEAQKGRAMGMLTDGSAAD